MTPEDVERRAILLIGARRWTVIGEDAKERAREQIRTEPQPIGASMPAPRSHRKPTAAPDPAPPTPTPLTFSQKVAAQLKVVAQLPTKWVAILSLADGVVTVLNQTTFGLPSAWKTLFTVLLGVFSFLGIGPLLGPKFKAALHISAALAGAVGVVLIVLLVVVQQDASMPYRAIIIGLVNVAGGLGFAPAYIPTL